MLIETVDPPSWQARKIRRDSGPGWRRDGWVEPVSNGEQRRGETLELARGRAQHSGVGAEGVEFLEERTVVVERTCALAPAAVVLVVVLAVPGRGAASEAGEALPEPRYDHDHGLGVYVHGACGFCTICRFAKSVCWS